MRAFGSDGKEIVSACYCLEAFFEVTIGKGEAMNFHLHFPQIGKNVRGELWDILITCKLCCHFRRYFD